jgi:hypothetical protein
MTCGVPKRTSLKNRVEGNHRSKFPWKKILTKNTLLYLTLHADHDYGVRFSFRINHFSIVTIYRLKQSFGTIEDTYCRPYLSIVSVFFCLEKYTKRCRISRASRICIRFLGINNVQRDNKEFMGRIILEIRRFRPL